MFSKILFAYDGSAHSKRAAKVAGDMARVQDTIDLFLVCVMEQVPKNLAEPFVQDYIGDQKKAAKEFFNEAKDIIGKSVNIHEKLLFGPPAENILDFAAQNHCDLIVMGARGLSVLEGLLMGSQVHKVINHSKCPVLVVK